jgi:hypothetical protein
MPLLSYPVRQPWKVHLKVGDRGIGVLTGQLEGHLIGKHYRLGAGFGAVIAADLSDQVKATIVS